MADARAPLKPGAASCEGAKRARSPESIRRAAARMRSAIPERGFGDAGRQLELHGLLDTRHRLDADRAQSPSVSIVSSTIILERTRRQ